MENNVMMDVYNEIKITELDENNKIVLLKDALVTGEYSSPFSTGYHSLDEAVKGGFRAGELVIVTGNSGEGKCFKAGTKILMHDGSLKNVEDIKIGDQIMGDDSTPRNVLKLGTGEEQMYEIYQARKNELLYTCNESHILSLKKYGKVVNISIRDFMKLSPNQKILHKGYRTGVEFKEQKLPIDPYFLGIWLGDGTCLQPAITNMDQEVIDYIYDFAKKQELQVKVYSKSTTACKTYKITREKKFEAVDKRDNAGYGNIKALSTQLRELNLLGNKHIPEIYKINSRENRLKLLAGILDTDGYYDNNCIEIVTAYEKLKDDIIFLAKSLGFAISFRKKIVKGYEQNNYWRIYISGEGMEELPMRVARKKLHKRQQIKDPLVFQIDVRPVGVDKYYGFELDGNKLFVLGDFSVTHNTTLCQAFTINFAKMGTACLWFSYEMVINDIYAKFKEMGADIDKLNVYVPKKITSEKTDWIRERIKDAVENKNVKIIFIDNLDFLSPTNIKETEKRLWIQNIVLEVKRCALEFNVIVILMAHVKKVEGRGIRLQDLAESAGTYKLADTVLAVSRDVVQEKIGGKLTEVALNTGVVRFLKNRIAGNISNMLFFSNVNGKIIPINTAQERKEEKKESYNKIIEQYRDAEGEITIGPDKTSPTNSVLDIFGDIK